MLTLDAHHLMRGLEPDTDVAAWLEQRMAALAAQWAAVRRDFGCQIIQTIPLPVFTPRLGGNEHRLPWSRAAALRRLSAMMRDQADQAGVDLLTLDDQAAQDGLAAWHDPALWHRAKQEIHPAAAPLYGDLVARLLAAAQGRSFKCLVLDLDNTLWGGVIGDDGLDGIELGQGSALGRGVRRVPALCARTWRGAASSSPSARRTTRPTRWSRSTATRRWCCGAPTSPASSPTGPTRPPTSAPSPSS